MSKNKALGKGLAALIGESKIPSNDKAITPVNNGAPLLIELANLIPMSNQPRRYFSEEALNELASSIKLNGVLSPIIVRPLENSNKFQIIAGERRWRASKIAGLKEMPVLVKDIDEKTALEIALIENIQRQDLSPIEEAEGYKRLIDEFSYTQEQLSAVVGKSRSHVTNLLRLLSLPHSIKQLVSDNSLSMGHARALINFDNAEELAKKIIDDGLSVRDTEKLVKNYNLPSANENAKHTAKTKTNAKFKPQDEDITGLEEMLSENLGMKVKIESDNNGGKVIINFYSLEQLDIILQKLS